MEVHLLLLLGGRGRRMGGELPKQYLNVQGKAIFMHCLHHLAKEPRIAVVQPVIAAGDTYFAHAVAGACFPFELRKPVSGGSARSLSMLAGLSALDASAEWVAVHDAARPLVSATLLSQLFDCAAKHGAAVPGVAVHDTIKQVDQNGHVVKTLRRQSLSAIQTPQVARKAWFEEAIDKVGSGLSGCTDDASILEAAAFPVYISAGDSDNRKITTREDLAWLNQRLDVKGEER